MTYTDLMAIRTGMRVRLCLKSRNDYTQRTMALGASLFWIALVALLVFGARFVTQKKKWRLVGKIIGGLVVLCIAIGLAIWGWNAYKGRPQPVDALGSISLGMTPVEVTLALGEPNNTNPNDVSDGHRRYLYMEYGTLEYFIKFSDAASSSEHVQAVCSGDYNNGVFGLSKYSSQKDVIKKLGNPISQSIHKDELRKMISYPEWKVSYEIEKGDVVSVCVSENGDMQYLEEYGF